MQVVSDEPLMRRLEAQLGHCANRLMLKGDVEEIVVLHEALMESQHFLFTERLSREVAWFLKHHIIHRAQISTTFIGRKLPQTMRCCIVCQASR